MAGFDPTHAVRFELSRGRVVAGGDERSVVLPCAALDNLVLVAATEAAAAIGRAIGANVGQRIASRLGGAGGVRGASLERVMSESPASSRSSGSASRRSSDGGARWSSR